MNERQRCGYLDLVKLIAMVSVCLYHFPLIRTASYSDPLTAGTLVSRYLRGLNSICVPLFMMVNGALLLSRPFDAGRHLRRTVKLFAGVYIWYVITQLAGHLALHGGAYVAQNLTGILRSALYLYEYDGVALTHLWFVQMLVAVYLLFPLLAAAVHSDSAQLRRGLFFFAGAMVCLCFLTHDLEHVRTALPGLRRLDLSGLETMNPLRGSYGAMVVYFLLGGALHRQRARMEEAPLWLPLLLVTGGSLALFAEWLAMTRRTEALYDIVYYGYNCLPTLCMASGVFVLSAKLDAALAQRGGAMPGVVRLVGRNTLAVYYLHWILGLTVLPLVAVPGSLPVNLVKALLMVLAGSLLGEGMRRVPGLRLLV